MRRAAVHTTGLLVTALLLGLPVPASGSCAAPSLDVAGATPSPSPGLGGEQVPVVRLQAGQPVRVTGGGFPNFCDDTGSSGGCGQPRDPEPLRDVELVVVQGERRAVLGTADADPVYTVTWDVALPADLVPGRAALVAGGVGLDVEVVR